MINKTIKTPCINICEPDKEKNICKGCFRTPNEISKWIFYADEERERIINSLSGRKKEYLNEQIK
ncbi:MAG: DUF1289 domain-containing protein [Ignavibacteria bacterium]